MLGAVCSAAAFAETVHITLAFAGSCVFSSVATACVAALWRWTERQAAYVDWRTENKYRPPGRYIGSMEYMECGIYWNQTMQVYPANV